MSASLGRTSQAGVRFKALSKNFGVLKHVRVVKQMVTIQKRAAKMLVFSSMPASSSRTSQAEVRLKALSKNAGVLKHVRVVKCQ